MSLENKITNWKGKLFNSKLGKAIVGGSLLLALSGCGDEKSSSPQTPSHEYNQSPTAVIINFPDINLTIDNNTEYSESSTGSCQQPTECPNAITCPSSVTDTIINITNYYNDTTSTVINDPPELVKDIPDYNGLEDNVLKIYLADYIYDPNTLRLYYEIIKNSSATSVSTMFDGDWLIFTPAKDVNGTFAFKIGAFDGNSHLESNEFNITFEAVNDPVFSKKEQNYIGIPEDGTCTLDLSQLFGDVDSILRYEAKFSSTDLSAVFTDSTMKIIPNANINGLFDLLLTAYDEEYSSSTTATVKVEKVNDAPYFTVEQLPNIITDDENSAKFDLNKYIADIDGDKLECFFGTWPGEFLVNVVDCVATIIPRNKFVGIRAATLCVIDNSAQTCKSVNLESRICYNDAGLPMQNTTKISVTRNEDTTAVYNLLADICSPSGSLTFTITTPSPNINASISGSNITMSSKIVNYNGADQIGIRACNPAGCIDTTVYLLTVAVNDSPVLITPLPDFSDEFIQTHQIYLTNSFKDIDSTLTFSYEDPGNYFNVSIVNGIASVTPKDYNFISTSLKFKTSDGQYEISDWVTISYTYGCTTTNNYFSQQPDGSWKGFCLSRFYETLSGIPVKKGDTISSTVTGTICWYTGNCAGPNQTGSTWGQWAKITCGSTTYGPIYIGGSYTAKLDYLPDGVTCQFIPILPDGSSVSSCNGDLRPDNLRYFNWTATVIH